MFLRRVLGLMCWTIVASLAWPGAAAAQPRLDIAPAVCVAPLSVARTPAQALAWRGYDCAGKQYRHGPGSYWVLSGPLPARTAGRHVHVRVNSLWQQRLTLHALYADGRIATMRADSREVSRHVQLGAVHEFALPYREVALSRLLWRVDGSANARGILLGLNLMGEHESAAANLRRAALYSGFAGLAIALIVYNLAIWGAMRHGFQLAYCGMVAALLVYAFSSSGALAWFVPIDNNDRIRLNYVMLGLGAGAALLFARTFFEPRVFQGWLGRVTCAAAALVASSGILFAGLSIVDMSLADTLSSYMFLVGLAVVIPILWQAGARGSRYLWLFAISWAAPVLFAGVRIMAGLHLVEANFWIDNSTVLSMTLEALLSSLAIAYRVRMLSSERDAAREAELLARQLADVDPLTGLLNRRAFLGLAIGRFGPQTLHVIDIDHFKSVNDTLGHDGGDEVLRLFARTLRALVPAGALVARLGGEEFAILTRADAPVDPEHILSRLRAARMPFDLGVTASIGSCAGPLDTDADWKRLYHAADRALFDAKATGRDRNRWAMPLAAAA